MSSITTPPEALPISIRLVCPKCGRVQMRERLPGKKLYTCRKCFHRYTEVDSRRALHDRK
jgi:uncharacterized protein (DUF983 family)